jgi:ppGpp synthetase/RelA/SpoT-type nucleotidyltranferase
MVNNRKNKSKPKRKNKTQTIKTLTDRINEIKTIKEKLNSLGLSSEFEPIKLFYKECNKYVRDGYGITGSTKLTGLKRILEYKLTTRRNIECSITLKYDENI